MIRRAVTIALVLAAAVLFWWLVWPTPWLYIGENRLIRVHRVTDRTQELYDSLGWTDVKRGRTNPFADLAGEEKRIKAPRADSSAPR